MKHGPGHHQSPLSRALRGEYVPGVPVPPNPWFRQQEQRKEQQERLRRQQEEQLQAQRTRERHRQDRQRLERQEYDQSVASGAETDGSVVSAGWGEEVPWTCSRCQAENRARASYCHNCGEPLRVQATRTEGDGAAAATAWHGETHGEYAAREQSASRTRVSGPAFTSTGRRWSVAGQLAALGACIALVLLVRVTHNYISYGHGFESLWDASRTGGDASSPLREVDFRNLIALVAVCFGLITVGLVILRRALTALAAVVGLLVIGQLVRFWVGLGPRWTVSHTLGTSFWLSLAAAAVIAVGATVAALTSSVERD